MTTIDRRREPAGSPVGGRFAALVRDAPRDLGPWTRSGFDRDEARAWHSVGLDPVTAALFGPIVSVIGGGIGTLIVVTLVARFFPELRSLGSLHNLEAHTPAETPLAIAEEVALGE